MFTANVLKAFSKPFSVVHYHIDVVFYILARFAVAIASVVGVGVFNLQSVVCPIGKIASFEDSPYMFLLLL